MEKTLTERAEKMIKPIAERLKILSANTVIAYGKGSKEVLYNNEVDLNITGSCSRHGLQLILDSTANALLDQC